MVDGERRSGKILGMRKKKIKSNEMNEQTYSAFYSTSLTE
jgi:hypothetical protein